MLFDDINAKYMEALRAVNALGKEIEKLQNQPVPEPPAPKPVPSSVFKQFSAEFWPWDGNSNMTTPLQGHSFYLSSPSLYGAPSSIDPKSLTSTVAMEIHPGDPQWTIDTQQPKPRHMKRRVEMSWEPWRFAYGKIGWAGALFFLPSDPMADNFGTSIFQLHSWPDDSAFWNIHTADGKLKSDSPLIGSMFELDIDPYLDRWVKMVVSFRATKTDDGFIHTWLDDKLIYAHNGPTRKNAGQGPYFKNGLYYWGYERFDKAKHAKAYFDRLRITDSTGIYDDVDPSKW